MFWVRTTAYKQNNQGHVLVRCLAVGLHQIGSRTIGRDRGEEVGVIWYLESKSSFLVWLAFTNNPQTSVNSSLCSLSLKTQSFPEYSTPHRDSQSTSLRKPSTGNDQAVSETDRVFLSTRWNKRWVKWWYHGAGYVLACSVPFFFKVQIFSTIQMYMSSWLLRSPIAKKKKYNSQVTVTPWRQSKLPSAVFPIHSPWQNWQSSVRECVALRMRWH